MISVHIDIGEHRVELEMTGHSGMMPRGQDIVCSAASVLGWTAAQTLKEMQARGKVQEFKAEFEPGRTYVEAETEDRDARTAMRTIQRGYDLMRHRYPEHVKTSW